MAPGRHAVQVSAPLLLSAAHKLLDNWKNWTSKVVFKVDNGCMFCNFVIAIVV